MDYTKSKGNITELTCLIGFMSMGFDCSIPYGDNCRYDIIVDVGEELKELIRTKSFVQIGKVYGVSDNAVRRWCKNYNLPTRTSDIKGINSNDWKNL